MIDNTTVPVVITAGKKYNEIDGAACASAYAELLVKRGFEVRIFIKPEPNNTITKSVRKLLPYFDKSEDFTDKPYQIIVVDTSMPDFVEDVLDKEKVVEIFDHHFDNNDLWVAKLGSQAHIEEVGSCATLIYEEIKKFTDPRSISLNSKMLLLTAIAANTLNLKARVTKDRDIEAYNEIKNTVSLKTTWLQRYYNELDDGLVKDPESAISNDVKIITLNGESWAIAQMELWEGESFMLRNKPLIRKILENNKVDKWFYTSPCIARGVNYLYAESAETRDRLTRAIGAKFINDFGVTKTLWLRKEIIRELLKVT